MSRRAAIAVASALAAFAAAALPLGLRMAQQAAIAANAVPTARSYVQDGLVAMWDGIENAGWGVHDNNATAWVNLVGGVADMEFNEIFTNYTYWTDNAIVLADNSVTKKSYYRAHSPTTFKLTNDITIEGFAMAGTNNMWYVRQTMGLSCGHEMGGLNLFARGSYKRPGITTLEFYGMSFTAQYSDNFNIPGSDGINYANKGKKSSNVMVFHRDTTNFVGYINGKYVGEVQISADSILSETQLKSALDDYNYYPALVEVHNFGDQLQDYVIHAFRIYNRALTAEEIAHNAAIDRRRFGTAADAE